MTGTLDPIVKRLELEVSASRAFEHFTQSIAHWWPLSSHSLSGEYARQVVFEAQTGGRIYEIDNLGREREWGIVHACETDSFLAFSWVLERPDLATEVQVHFESVTQNSCILTLEHVGWDRRPDGVEWRGNYNSGWDSVLSQYSKTLD